MLKVLVPGATEEQIEKIQAEYEQAENGLLKQHLADVLRTAFESNEALFGKIKEEGKMSEAVERVFKKEIEEAAEKKRNRLLQRCFRIMNLPIRLSSTLGGLLRG